MTRIEKLRNRIFDNLYFSYEFYYYFHKEYEKLKDLKETERYAKSFRYAFSNLTPSITEGELIVGKRDVPMNPEQEKEWVEKYLPLAQARETAGGIGQASHMAIDYDLLLTKGITGIIDTIEQYKKDADSDTQDYYDCCISCLEAIVEHSHNYAECAIKMSENVADEQTKLELLKIAEICKKVPANPAESFYEAVQSVHFITYCITIDPLKLGSQQFQLGHPDRYLWPFYKKDIESGKITKEFAQELLDCLAIQINTRVPSGLSSGYMVGGRDNDGNIVANDLTLMCMQVVDDVRLVYPAVGLCHTKGTPEEYLDKAIELLLKGYSHPAIFNDDVISKGLIKYGVPENKAHNYIHSTCVEITPVGASSVWVASPYTNMPQILLDVMDREYDSLQDLIDAFFCRLDEKIKSNFEYENANRKIRAENSINPLLSCFVDDCLKSGRDVENGGAIYNWIMPSFVGMANLVDSIYAIKQLVFDEKKLSILEFKNILDKNFEGNEALRLYILNKISKYGNDVEQIDQYFDTFASHLVSECKKYKGIHRNADLIPSVFCWIMHERFGTETGATPDGRTSNFPLGDGSGPCQGREMCGPTASVISSTKWDHSDFIGGVAVNLKFSKASLGKNSAETVKAVVNTYLNRGGFEMQINVVDNQTLKEAQKNPENYRDLVVRIGGYSDYFVRLSSEMQQEVILRTEHNT